MTITLIETIPTEARRMPFSIGRALTFTDTMACERSPAMECVCISKQSILMSRYRVVAMPSPGMATQDSTDGQVKPLEGTVFQDGLHGILGTGGGEPAGRRLQGGNVCPIETDGQQQKSRQKFSHNLSSAMWYKSFFTLISTSSVS